MMQQSLIQRVARKLDKTVAGLFFVDQWVIMTARGADFRSLRWEAFTPLMPEKDRYWGDPFVVQRDGRYFVFAEEKLYASGAGRIVCLELDASGKMLSHRVVLEQNHHLSYPFVFERGGEMYMLPESAAHRTVDLYRCTRFPDTWEFVRTLMRDVYAVDATLLEHSGRSWLFTNIKVEGGSSLNSLHLFHTDDPITGTWSAHPRNPVVRGLGSARPAGRIFVHDGQLIRPSQDSSRRYGGALKFNRILQLDEHDYREEPVATFTPQGGGIRATHTFNQAGELTVIDAVLRRPK